ncbi:hypothetical protein [Flavobacterium algicola]|uniref:hypothetical protein n=1 Tax=Flavobacterium algicola TaxID=556529 RepID=UPI001EFE6F70|nr:hypothetical protein [Flavobacterium algicola]MCG9793587.1 hypothetical protein [Flavobacterium algicola]
MEKIFRPSPNSFKNTFCVFKEVNVDAIEGLKLQFESKAGSSYFYTKEGMFRYSNHWGRLANSKWRLIAMEQTTDSKRKLGFANWSDFYPDNAEEELYFIEVDYANNTVNYQHKLSPTFDSKSILRTSFETTKKIKQIRNLQQLNSWAKYFDYDDLDLLRIQIIDELVYSNKPLEAIKSELLKK